MKHLVVVPARGGSKGIPKKNIYPLCGKPLLSYTLETALAAGIDGDITVSTDADDIAEVAAGHEGVIVIKRPDELAVDTASTEDALIHALDYMKEKYGKEYDTVITLQPTSPMRTPETVKAFIENYEKNADKYDAQLTLTECRGDYWVCREDKFGRLFPNAPRRRQDREPIYLEDSCIYITDAKALREKHSVLGNNVNGFVISEKEGVDINEPVDLVIAGAFIEEKRG